MLKRSLAVFLIAASATLGFAEDHWNHPKLTPQKSGTTQLLIAVSPVNDRVVWAAGTGGTYSVTTDGGNTWKSGVVPGTEALQFRDVQGVSDKVAYLMSIGNDTTNFQNCRRRRDLGDSVRQRNCECVLRLFCLLEAELRHRAQRFGERSFSR